jgi:S1-C subfamily serine protease
VDGELVLIAVDPAAGWDADVDESRREIEVDLQRDELEIGFAAELRGQRLEIAVDVQIDPGRPGRYDLGAAGSIELTVDGDDLRVSTDAIADGWSLDQREDDDDEVELTIRRGDERWQVQVELDDDDLEMVIAYRTSGEVNRR